MPLADQKMKVESGRSSEKEPIKNDPSEAAARPKVAKPRVYLAQGLGFSSSARKHLLPVYQQHLERLGYEVIEPFDEGDKAIAAGEIDFKNPDWPLRICKQCERGIRRADCVVVLTGGQQPDIGAMIETGVALAQGKPVSFIHDTILQARDHGCTGLPGERIPVEATLMMASDRFEDWDKLFYESLEDQVKSGSGEQTPVVSLGISDPARRLAQFVKQFHAGDERVVQGDEAAQADGAAQSIASGALAAAAPKALVGALPVEKKLFELPVILGDRPLIFLEHSYLSLGKQGPTKRERQHLREERDALETMGFQVIDWQDGLAVNPQIDTSTPRGLWQAAKLKQQLIERADCVLVSASDAIPRAGAMVTYGFASERGKPLAMLRTTTAACSDNELYSVNLMVGVADQSFEAAQSNARFYSDPDEFVTKGKLLANVIAKFKAEVKGEADQRLRVGGMLGARMTGMFQANQLAVAEAGGSNPLTPAAEREAGFVPGMTSV